MNRLLLSSLLFVFAISGANAQGSDSIDTKKLREVLVIGQREINTVLRLPEQRNTYIYSGKKSEVINVQNLDANITERTPRQIFAKVPGVFVYDMDGTGNQMNISARGLDPHRGWEFNIRRDGAMTNSDIYGYPASHYSIPMEAVDRIELVRGTGSLQYGAQFGGMLNYVTKQPDSIRYLVLESINGVGSFGLLSTYNAVSGTVGKFQYYAYLAYRKSDGYRDNSYSDYDAQGVTLIYNASRKFRITSEFSRSNYVYQIPGPLTDSMFRTDPRMSTRSRNYFNPEIYVPSLKLEWQLTDNTRLQWMTSAVLGDRNSVMFDRLATIPDVIDPATGEYNARQVDIDQFNSYTTELRISHSYSLFNKRSTLAGGLQWIRNNLHRRQQGKGTRGTEFDLDLTDPLWGRNMHLRSNNLAAFMENNFKVTEKLSINPGLRMELGESKMYGEISYYNADDIPNRIEHRYPLFGISAQYQWKGSTLYGGWSQAYRPVIFKDIIPATMYEQVDKDLDDAFGYNMEVGYRGAIYSGSHVLHWDVSLFELQYNNRLGSQATYNEQDVFILYRTNIGDSKSRGAEIFFEYSMPLVKKAGLTLFTSTSLMSARYENATIRSGAENANISGNRVESVPRVITRNGLTVRAWVASVSLLYSYTGKTYADPLNTEAPNATGAVGVVPSYGLWDLNLSLRVAEGIKFRLNINNVTDEHYFTKRPAFYPGPGVWPSDGRSFTGSVGFKI